ncbi:hypothetical protein [Thermus sp. 93170]|uniref:hypothetical protein n=1 Tax=Thermus sp. 93170 TaxID=1046939 RepID=UPI003F440E69
MVLLSGTSARGGLSYRVRLQAAPTPDLLAGAALFGLRSRFYLDGAPAPMEGGPIAAGQNLRLELDPIDVLQRAGQGAHYAVVLAGDALGWGVAAAWPVTVDFRPLNVYLYLSRLPTGHGVASAVVHEEAPEEAEWTWEGGSASQAWTGLRRARDGSPVFFLLLPPEVGGEVQVRVRKGMRLGMATGTLSPWPPQALSRSVRWRLPFWLPPDLPPQREVLEALARVLGQPLPGLADLSPTTAAGQALATYARLFAAPPLPEEPEDLLRRRILAIPQGRYATAQDLEGALRVFTPYVSVNDRMNARRGLRYRLDGTWLLDGSATLGSGTAGDLQAGYYEIAIQDADAPPEWLVREAERLRPAGTLPIWRWMRPPSQPHLGAAHVGVREPAFAKEASLGLTGRRRLDGSWRLDGGAKLASGMVARDGPFLQ